MYGIGREALLGTLEVIPDVREWSGGPRGCPGVYGEAIPDVREWLRGPPGCPGVVGKPSRMTGSGRETLPNVRE